MIKIIDRYTEKLIANKIIIPEDKELYTYGFHQGMIIIANIATTILVGFIFGMVWQSIVFMLAYISLRSYAGGFHAKTQVRCNVYSVLLISAVLLLVKFIPWTSYAAIGLLLFSYLIIFILAPVEDSNKPLDKEEAKVYKRRTRLILGIETLIILLLMVFALHQIIVVISVSMFALACMLVIGKVKQDLYSHKAF